MVLLVVDTQKLLVNSKLYNFENFITNIRELINTSRKNNIEVLYVIHDDGVESDLTKGKDGFEVYEEFKPMEQEKVFVKNVNSSFRETGLLEYLREKGEKNIIVVGLQTDKCIDATIKCGFEHGFNMIVPNYANSTVDNEFFSGEQSYKYYNEFMWNDRYAKCISINTVFNMLEN
ncbi:TPA: cysteine hydrolase family protein [Clostridium perfringens]|uniref:cysteine hydrolase family protein n=1 Tax=Clostridium perfringens TaxID=1502 RepID=UPI001009A452|nr:cysteine hydrolase family protein [Clostridium perfringens]EJT5939269.1 cysteine hydrolase [Clostridium perfringens]EJT6471369.1 cysteine hydrolase [Clostridium perfringens]MDV5105300.1 cysteine hydrolase family protein [Clostridium perfringens]RXI80853.1 cysteine hydrolase [Clostridium perfringens]RXI83784.1 cysteine hydrolase [Clostridium perfringens]